MAGMGRFVGKWVCLKMVSTPKPNGFADHYPYEMAISLGIYPIFRQTQIMGSFPNEGWKTLGKSHFLIA